MPTQNSTQTYEMLKTYLDETADSFEKLDEEPGFLYRKTDGRKAHPDKKTSWGKRETV